MMPSSRPSGVGSEILAIAADQIHPPPSAWKGPISFSTPTDLFESRPASEQPAHLVIQIATDAGAETGASIQPPVDDPLYGVLIGGKAATKTRAALHDCCDRRAPSKGYDQERQRSFRHVELADHEWRSPARRPGAVDDDVDIPQAIAQDGIPMKRGMTSTITSRGPWRWRRRAPPWIRVHQVGEIVAEQHSSSPEQSARSAFPIRPFGLVALQPG